MEVLFCAIDSSLEKGSLRCCFTKTDDFHKWREFFFVWDGLKSIRRTLRTIAAAMETWTNRNWPGKDAQRKFYFHIFTDGTRNTNDHTNKLLYFSFFSTTTCHMRNIYYIFEVLSCCVAIFPCQSIHCGMLIWLQGSSLVFEFHIQFDFCPLWLVHKFWNIYRMKSMKQKEIGFDDVCAIFNWSNRLYAFRIRIIFWNGKWALVFFVDYNLYFGYVDTLPLRAQIEVAKRNCSTNFHESKWKPRNE